MFYGWHDDCTLEPPNAQPTTTTKTPTTTPPTTTIEPTEPPDRMYNIMKCKSLYISVRYNIILISNFDINSCVVILTATIVCDFVDDWCNFARTTNGDGSCKNGFGWIRKTADEIKNQHLEGPQTSN